MTFATTFLEQGRQAPADIATRLADFLAAARTSLHLAIYDFRLSDAPACPIVTALRARAAAGVDVRLVYDAGKPNFDTPKAGADPAPPGTADFVKRLLGGLPTKPITGGDPHQPRLMHQKYVIRDGASIWTGSSNWTDDSWSLQENNLLCIDSPELAGYYERDFSELWQRGDLAATGARDTGTVGLGPASLTVSFAPGEGLAIDHAIAGLIASARRRLRLGSMLLTSGAILGALNDALKHRDLDYGGIYDRTQMDGVIFQWRDQPSRWKIPAFEQAAAPLVGKRSTPYAPGTPHDFMHNKVLVADDTVVTGSYNFSHSATANAENVLMIRDAELAERYVAYLDGLTRRYGAKGTR